MLPDTMCSLQQITMTQGPTQKFGYVDIKQHSKVRPRKLKTWKRRWAVLTKMSNLSSDEYVAKLDLYDNETKWQSNCSDKTTFVLENVTSIQQTKSRTHQHAFEVVEKQPVLVMSGSSEEETYSWILTLQQVFTPSQILASKGDYQVTLLANQNSSEWNLSGEFTLSISPACVSLKDLEGRSVVSWGLNTLKKFHVDKCPITGQKTVLVMECGPNSPTGQSYLRFQSDDAHSIMCSIRQSICVAVALKEQAEGIHAGSRKASIVDGERSIRSLLDNHQVLNSLPRNRSDSESSSTTANQKSPSVKLDVPFYHVPFFTSNLHAEEKLRAKTGEEQYVWDVHANTEDSCTCSNVSVPVRTISLSGSKKSNNEIRDTIIGQFPISENHPFISEPPEIDIRRLRSVSTVVAAIKARCDQEPSRVESPNNDKITDIDSAISSMVSAPNDDLLWMDMQQYQDVHVNGNQPSGVSDFLIHREKLTTRDISENEYEDIEELRVALQRINKEQDSATPPALPARPASMTSSFYASRNKCAGVRTGSTFKRNETFNSSETNTKTTSHLQNVNVEMSCAVSELSLCDVCGGYRPSRKLKSGISKIPSTEHLFLDVCSCVHEARVSTKDVACVRCSSSNKTPKTASYCFDKNTTDSISKTSKIHLRGKELPVPPRSNLSLQNLTNGSEKQDRLETEVAKSTLMSNAVNNNLSDPLINFFLDNANFGVNPIVTGELSAAKTSLSNRSEILIPTSISATVLANQTLAMHKLKHEDRPNSNVHQCDNDFSAFDTWTLGQFKNEQGIPLSKISFDHDHSIWNQNGISLPSNVSQNTQSDYIAMMNNSNSWHSKLTTDMNGMRNAVTFLSGDRENLAFSGKLAHDIYVQPNNIPSVVKQCQQFRNVY